MTDSKLAERGDLTSDQHRPASKCEDCRSVWYTQDESQYCPNCASENVVDAVGLPGAILLQPGVDWPEDDPFVGGED